MLTSKINEDDGNNADNEKSVYLSSPLRPPLAPRRSPFHYSPSPEHYKERDDNEEKEIMDLLAHAPNVLNGRQSNTFHNDPKGYVDSPDDLKNISLGNHSSFHYLVSFFNHSFISVAAKVYSSKITTRDRPCH